MARDGYKDIDITGGKSVTVEFGEDTSKETAETEVIVEDISLEEATKVPEAPAKEIEVPAKEVEEKPKKAETKKKSRAQKRIRQLNSEKQEAVLRAERAEQEKRDLELLLQEGNKTSNTSMKGALEKQVTTLISSLREAMESGNSDAVVTLTDDLMNAKMELAGVSHELKQAESVPAPTKAPTQPLPPQLPEPAIEWLEEHPGFNTDEMFRASTIATNNQMLSEGWNLESDEFYTELSTRLSKRFPEQFGIDEKNSVESKVDKNQSTDEHTDVKDKPSTAKARSVEQTVSGSSRPSTMAVNSPVKKNSVTLSPQDVEQAERWGLSLEQMARRIAHAENNKRKDGYVPIQLG